MAIESGCPVTNEEVQMQLHRILSSKIFSEAYSQAEVLNEIVTSALAGREITANSIGFRVFPGYYAGASSDVRVTIGNLRKQLAKYYARDGADDPVIIGLPSPRKGKNSRGQAYRPIFSYAGLPNAQKHHKGGLYYLSRGDFGRAEVCFEWASVCCPTFAPAFTSAAEAMLFKATFGSWGCSFENAERSAQRALDLDAQSSRAHLMMGVLLGCRSRWEDAQREFDTAMKIEPRTRESWWYLSFLLATSETDQALKIARKRFDDNPYVRLPPRLTQTVKTQLTVR